MLTVCERDQCAGCMLCTDICPKQAIRIEDSYNAYNAVIDHAKCINCNLCHNKCPQNNTPAKVEPFEWYQGWNKEFDVRDNAPSGGVGMALAKQFVSEGGYVCSCVFRDGGFGFEISNDSNEVLNFGGSKYVKSNPKGIYKEISEVLKKGNKVLFIGLPCQVAAVKTYVAEAYHDNLYLVDLICHGTPSPKLLDKFLNQYSKSLNGINDIKFRIKAKMQIVIGGNGIVCTGVSDKYTIAFLKGLTYTNNCYSCKYASGDRISDITIGDSWGTKLAPQEVKKGVSLMLVQTEKGKKLLEASNVDLFPVDVQTAKDNNEQLVNPMKKPEVRATFFDKLADKPFNKLVFSRFPKECMKQDVKYILVKLGLIH